MELRKKLRCTKACRVKDFHMLVYASLYKLLSLHGTNGSTERVNCEIRNHPCGCGNLYWAQTGRGKKITPTPNECLHSPNHRHSPCGEPDHVGQDRDEILRCSNPHGISLFWGTQYDSFACLTLSDISWGNAATGCSTFWYPSKLQLQLVLRSDITKMRHSYRLYLLGPHLI